MILIIRGRVRRFITCGQLLTLYTMEIIFVLIIVSLVIALGFLAAFIWAIRSGQYDDDYTPSVRILFEDEKQI